MSGVCSLYESAVATSDKWKKEAESSLRNNDALSAFVKYAASTQWMLMSKQYNAIITNYFPSSANCINKIKSQSPKLDAAIKTLGSFVDKSEQRVSSRVSSGLSSGPGDFEITCSDVSQVTGSDCVTFDSIIGLEDIKDAFVQSLLNPILYPSLFPNMSRGILLYGPPGGGKTMIMKAVARELQDRGNGFLNVMLFAPTGAELKGMYVGETEKRIKALWTCAQRAAECCADGFTRTIAIVFIDEIDSIAGSRTADTGGLMANSVNTLLQMMDGLKTLDNVVTVGATNLPWQLDSAVLRRFPDKFYLGPSTSSDKADILSMHMCRYINNMNRGMVSTRSINESISTARVPIRDAGPVASSVSGRSTKSNWACSLDTCSEEALKRIGDAAQCRENGEWVKSQFIDESVINAEALGEFSRDNRLKLYSNSDIANVYVKVTQLMGETATSRGLFHMQVADVAYKRIVYVSDNSKIDYYKPSGGGAWQSESGNKANDAIINSYIKRGYPARYVSEHPDVIFIDIVPAVMKDYEYIFFNWKDIREFYANMYQVIFRGVDIDVLENIEENHKGLPDKINSMLEASGASDWEALRVKIQRLEEEINNSIVKATSFTDGDFIGGAQQVTVDVMEPINNADVENPNTGFQYVYIGASDEQRYNVKSRELGDYQKIYKLRNEQRVKTAELGKDIHIKLARDKWIYNIIETLLKAKGRSQGLAGAGLGSEGKEQKDSNRFFKDALIKVTGMTADAIMDMYKYRYIHIRYVPRKALSLKGGPSIIQLINTKVDIWTNMFGDFAFKFDVDVINDANPIGEHRIETIVGQFKWNTQKQERMKELQSHGYGPLERLIYITDSFRSSHSKFKYIIENITAGSSMVPGKFKDVNKELKEFNNLFLRNRMKLLVPSYAYDLPIFENNMRWLGRKRVNRKDPSVEMIDNFKNIVPYKKIGDYKDAAILGFIKISKDIKNFQEFSKKYSQSISTDQKVRERYIEVFGNNKPTNLNQKSLLERAGEKISNIIRLFSFDIEVPDFGEVGQGVVDTISIDRYAINSNEILNMPSVIVNSYSYDTRPDIDSLMRTYGFSKELFELAINQKVPGYVAPSLNQKELNELSEYNKSGKAPK